MKIPGLYLKRGVYYYRPPQVGGVRPAAVSLRTKDLVEAIEMAQEMLAQSTERIGAGRLDGEIERFLLAKATGGDYTRLTAVSSKSVLRRFSEDMGNPLVSRITQDDILTWKAKLLERGFAHSSLAGYMVRVMAFFTWCVQTKRISKSPCKGVKLPVVRATKRNLYCSKEERDILIAACPPEKQDLKFFLMAGFFLGMRPIEIIAAVPAWFEHPGYVEVTSVPPDFMPKDKQKRIIHYGPRFAAFLKDYGLREPFMLAPNHPYTQALRRWAPRRQFQAVAQAAGLPWVTPYVMRHTFATLHLLEGTPMSLVADWLGDNIDTVDKHYAGYAFKTEHVSNID